MINIASHGEGGGRPGKTTVQQSKKYARVYCASNDVKINTKQSKFSVYAYPVAEIVGEGDVSRERVGECRVEVKDFEQPVALDDVKVTVGQRSHVRRRLADRLDLPEQIPEHVAFA